MPHASCVSMCTIVLITLSLSVWIEHGEFDSAEEHPTKRHKLENGQEIGWMTESDMASVGITSGVRKVLAKVQQTTK